MAFPVSTIFKYMPFTEDSLKAYTALAGQDIDAAAAQGALKGLREKNLVWQPAYGDYALEDESMATWYQHRGPAFHESQVESGMTEQSGTGRCPNG